MIGFATKAESLKHFTMHFEDLKEEEHEHFKDDKGWGNHYFGSGALAWRMRIA